MCGGGGGGGGGGVGGGEAVRGSWQCHVELIDCLSLIMWSGHIIDKVHTRGKFRRGSRGSVEPPFDSKFHFHGNFGYT